MGLILLLFGSELGVSLITYSVIPLQTSGTLLTNSERYLKALKSVFRDLNTQVILGA